MFTAKNSFEEHAIRIEKYSESAKLTQENKLLKDYERINVSHCQHSASILEESICDRIYICDKFQGQGRNEKTVSVLLNNIFVLISLRELQILISGIE